MLALSCGENTFILQTKVFCPQLNSLHTQWQDRSWVEDLVQRPGVSGSPGLLKRFRGVFDAGCEDLEESDQLLPLLGAEGVEQLVLGVDVLG